MIDPIDDLADLLQPVAKFTKLVTAAGSWSLTRTEVNQPYFCACLEGEFALAVDNHEPVVIREGDFVLIPLARRFESFSLDRKPGDLRQSIPLVHVGGEFRLGNPGGSPDMRMTIGFGEFAADNPAFLANLLPPFVHVKGDPRLLTLVSLIDDEARIGRSSRTGAMTRLLNVLLIEALRSDQAADVTPGLLRALADDRIGTAVRAIHAEPGRNWTVSTLAEQANLSRSAFFDRFREKVMMAPMEYVLHWRMHLAKQLLPKMPTYQVAAAVGYGSTSAFSTAFSRVEGRAPSAWLRQRQVRQSGTTI